MVRVIVEELKRKVLRGVEREVRATQEKQGRGTDRRLERGNGLFHLVLRMMPIDQRNVDAAALCSFQHLGCICAAQYLAELRSPKYRHNSISKESALREHRDGHILLANTLRL